MMDRYRFFSVLWLVFSALITAGISSAAEYSGRVVDKDGNPINNAIIRIQGSPQSTRTDRQGHFRLDIGEKIISGYITAGKFGFYNGAQPITSKKNGYHVVLPSIPKTDNKRYRWVPSLQPQEAPHDADRDESQPCQTCHSAVVAEWRQDAHSESARNPFFLSFFNGSDMDGEHTAGPGYRLDFPTSNGNCAACHVPALAQEQPFHPDPNEVRGIAEDGIFCDFCHKISGVALDHTGGRPGVLSLRFARPEQGRQLFYGPYPDVFPGEDAYHPLYKKSLYCAPCHHGQFWDVLAYSEFQEWRDSRYRIKNIHCQDCHMPSNEMSTRFALEEKGGIRRPPGTIPSHVNLGIRDELFMQAAIELNLRPRMKDETIEIQAVIKNVNAGHHYPTGNPMRNMILIVDVRDDDGNPLSMIQGERVPSWGGVGDIKEGNYAGLPGKGFAKVLKDAVLYPDNQRKHFQFEFPAPHWRPTVIASDNRIPADGEDVSMYTYKMPSRKTFPLHISATLIYRRTYKPWSDRKGMDIPDLVIAQVSTKIRR